MDWINPPDENFALTFCDRVSLSLATDMEIADGCRRHVSRLDDGDLAEEWAELQDAISRTQEIAASLSNRLWAGKPA